MTSGRRPLWALTIIVATAAVFVLALFRITSYDVWFLFKTGELILDTGSAPRTDPFSYTSYGKPWIMHEWLFCVLAELARRYMGLAWVSILKAAVIAAAFLTSLLTSAMRASGRFRALVPLASLIVLGACASRFRFLARPHIFNFLGLALVMLIVELFFAGRRKWLFLLPLLVVVWANIQAGAIIGPAYLWLRLVSALIERRFSRDGERGLEGRALFMLLLITLLSSVALAANPYGLHIFDFVKSALWEHRGGGELSVIEWTPPDARFKLFWALLAVAWAFIIGNWRKCRVSDILETLLATGLALMARRYIPLFFLITTPVIGGIASRLSSFHAEEARRSALARLFGVAPPLAACVAVALTLARPGPFVPGVGVNRGAYPVGGVDFVINHGIQGNMYNSHRFGGYIIYRAYPERRVFIDGRNVVHKALWKEFTKRTFVEIADEYGIDYAVVDYAYDSRRRAFSSQLARAKLAAGPGSPAEAQWLDWWRRRGGWHLVFWDDNCTVYVDGSEKFREVRGRCAYTILDPVGGRPGYLSGYLANEETRQRALDEAQRAVSESPRASSCRLLLASVLLNVGEPARSIEQFREALRIAPDSEEASAGLRLAEAALAKGASME